MTTTRRTARSAFAAIIVTLAAAPVVSAQDALPPAAEIIERYQKAIGGTDAAARIQQMHSVGEFSMPAFGMTGAFESWSARPNRVLMRITLPGFGEIRSGYDGEVAWSISPNEGPKVLQGAEKTQTADNADFDSMLRDAAKYTSMETVEKTTLGGKECYKVKLVAKSGRQTHDCFSTETGLLVGTIATQATSMGDVEGVTLFDGYRDFNGLQVATKMTIQAMGMDQIITISDVHFGEMPVATFALPAEIKALVK